MRSHLTPHNLMATDNVKYCSKCQDSKPKAEFHLNRSQHDGRARECKSCYKDYLREKAARPYLRKPRKRFEPTAKDLDLNEQPLLARKIALALAENPKASPEEIAIKCDSTEGSIRQQMSKNGFLRMLKIVSSEKMALMLPNAVQAFAESLNARSEDVKLKAATRLLESEKVLGPDHVDVTINDYSGKTTQELWTMLCAIKVPQPTIQDAEVIS